MNPKEIKKALIDLDLTQAEVARKLGVTRFAVNRAIHGTLRSKRIMNFLKELLNQSKKAA